eukprot:159413_1
MRGYKKEMNQYKLKIMNITHQALKQFTLKYYNPRDLKRSSPKLITEEQLYMQINEYSGKIFQFEKCITIAGIIYECRKESKSKRYGSVAIVLDPHIFGNFIPNVLMDLLKNIGYSNSTIKIMKVSSDGNKISVTQVKSITEVMASSIKKESTKDEINQDVIHLFPVNPNLSQQEFMAKEIGIASNSEFDLVFIEHKCLLNMSIIPNRYAMTYRPVDEIFNAIYALITDFIDLIQLNNDVIRAGMVAIVQFVLYELSSHDQVFWDIYSRTKEFKSMDNEFIKLLAPHFYLTKQAKTIVDIGINPKIMSRKMMSSILDFIIECFETITVMKSDALKKTVQQIPP